MSQLLMPHGDLFEPLVLLTFLVRWMRRCATTISHNHNPYLAACALKVTKAGPACWRLGLGNQKEP